MICKKKKDKPETLQLDGPAGCAGSPQGQHFHLPSWLDESPGEKVQTQSYISHFKPFYTFSIMSLQVTKLKLTLIIHISYLFTRFIYQVGLMSRKQSAYFLRKSGQRCVRNITK